MNNSVAFSNFPSFFPQTGSNVNLNENFFNKDFQTNLSSFQPLDNDKSNNQSSNLHYNAFNGSQGNEKNISNNQHRTQNKNQNITTPFDLF
jgi:hypothetical protein